MLKTLQVCLLIKISSCSCLSSKLNHFKNTPPIILSGVYCDNAVNCVEDSITIFMLNVIFIVGVIALRHLPTLLNVDVDLLKQTFRFSFYNIQVSSFFHLFRSPVKAQPRRPALLKW